MYLKKVVLNYVGSFRSVSKANNPFAIGYFTGDPDDNIKDKCTGLVGYKFFVNPDLVGVLSSLNVGAKVKADILTSKSVRADGKVEYSTNLVGLEPFK